VNYKFQSVAKLRKYMKVTLSYLVALLNFFFKTTLSVLFC